MSGDEGKDEDRERKLDRLIQLSSDIERVVEGDKKARWLWALARSIALWVTAVIVGIASVKGFIVEMLGGGKH